MRQTPPRALYVTRRLLAALLVLAAGLAACGADAEDVAAPGDAAPSVTAAEGFPLEVENCGRTLTFDAPPERIVTSYHSTFELVAELGAGDRLIGRTAYDEEGPDGAGVRPEHRDVYDAASQISDDTTLPAAEVMLSLGADLVISEGYYNFDAGQGAATIEEFEQAGANVYIVGGWCSADAQLDFDVDVLLEDIRTLGAIFGVPDRGEELAGELSGMLEDVEAATADVERAEVILIDANPDVIFAMGQGMGDQIAELAGLGNPFGESGDTYGEYGPEAIADSGADGFAVITYPPATLEERIAVIEDVAPNTPAVQDQRYVPITALATHPGYSTFLAIRDLAEGFYPEQFR